MKTLKQYIPLLMTTAVILLFVLYLANNHQMTSPITWSDITPGITTQAEVLEILGQPDKTEIRNGSSVYIYRNRESLGWPQIEVWFLIGTKEFIVGGTTLYFPDKNTADRFRFADIVNQYKKPNYMNWSCVGGERFYAWTEHGIAVSANVNFFAYSPNPTLADIKTIIVYHYIPKSFLSFTSYPWPWHPFGGWCNSNLYAKGKSDSPDTLPKEPINWKLYIE